jgi:dihydroxyacetone kinase-like protein
MIGDRALDVRYWRDAVARMLTAFEAEHGWLCELDAAIGDGDHGTSMVFGFREAARRLGEEQTADVGAVLRVVGAAFTARVGGVTGALFGALFTACGAAAEGKQETGAADFARMFSSAVEAVGARGKAAEGDKSMLDALAPAWRALEEAAARGADASAALAEAAAAAAAGAESTRAMVARVGRARYQGEKSVGHLDAGAVSVALIFRVLAESCPRSTNQGGA